MFLPDNFRTDASHLYPSPPRGAPAPRVAPRVFPLVRTGQGDYRRDFNPAPHRLDGRHLVRTGTWWALGIGIGAMIAIHPATGITFAVGLGAGMLALLLLRL